MAGETVAFLVAVVLLLIGVAWFRRRESGTGTPRAASSNDPWGRWPDLPDDRQVAPPAASPPRDPDAPGLEVLAHLRRLEARASPGLAATVIPIFLKDTADRLAALRAAVADEDGSTAHRIAHTLHGSAATVGATMMVRGCAEIIREVRTGSFERCPAIMTDMDADFESIRRVAEANKI